MEDHRASPAGGSGVPAAIVELLHDLRAKRPDAHGVGIGAAGMVDRDGVVRNAPNLPRLRGVPLRAEVEQGFGQPVVVDNDANVAALAELEHGAARGHRDVLVVTLGTGVGGGILSDGKIFRGAHGFAAEIGHFQVDPKGPLCACGQRGHWEAVASGNALGRLGREWAEAGRVPGVLARAGGDASAVTGEHVGDAALSGDVDAAAVLGVYAGNVAAGLAGLVNILDPEMVVVSGGLVALGDVLLDPVRTELAARIEASDAWPAIAVVAAELGEQAGVVGAAVLARDLDVR